MLSDSSSKLLFIPKLLMSLNILRSSEFPLMILDSLFISPDVRVNVDIGIRVIMFIKSKLMPPPNSVLASMLVP